jgi:membrane-associated phospholipid phosphatase
MLALVLVTALISQSGEVAPPVPPSTNPEPPAPDFTSEGQPGSYLTWYGGEYIGVVAAGSLLLAGATDSIEPLPALIGPQVDLKKPDLSVILDPRLDDVIGHPILQEKVPTLALAIGIASVVVADAGLDLALRQDLHRTHAILLGGAEAVVGAMVITEGLKLTFGRLRPDFRERWVRAACGGVVKKPDDLSCDGVLDDGFQVDRQFLLDGMKSFVSGHASTSFAAATFLGLQLGSEHVWGRHTPEWVRPIGALAIGGLLAGAGYVTATRVEDNRHHLEDITTGAAIGVASGLSAYLIHFDLEGNARRRGVAVAPLPVEGGAGVAVTGSLE